jgi:hypothetical protein
MTWGSGLEMTKGTAVQGEEGHIHDCPMIRAALGSRERVVVFRFDTSIGRRLVHNEAADCHPNAEAGAHARARTLRPRAPP